MIALEDDLAITIADPDSKDEVLEWFKKQVDDAGGGNYQTLIDQAFHEYMVQTREPLDQILRRVVREELKHAS